MESLLNEMITGIDSWLQSVDYNYIECNHVPESLLGNSRKMNVAWRTFFRLSPVNFRKMNWSLDKSWEKLYHRVLSLRSPKVKNFALKQGIRIAVNLYENDAEDPTPLNTVWFAQFLLDEETGLIGADEKKGLLFSIAAYLTEELGYADHGEDGVYFYYGPTLKKEIYNASAIISAFLIRLGDRYGDNMYLDLGQRGIKYVCGKQNTDGSWFYAGKPSRQTIDCFHQSYVLQAICSVRNSLPFDVASIVGKGITYYRSMFIKQRDGICPVRYDKRFTPRNTWLFVKVDGRDLAEALVFFSAFVRDDEMINGLLQYTYDKFYDKKHKRMFPEIFIYGKNRIPYIEFQAWFLYAFQIVKQSYGIQ